MPPLPVGPHPALTARLHSAPSQRSAPTGRRSRPTRPYRSDAPRPGDPRPVPTARYGPVPRLPPARSHQADPIRPIPSARSHHPIPATPPHPADLTAGAASAGARTVSAGAVGAAAPRCPRCPAVPRPVRHASTIGARTGGTAGRIWSRRAEEPRRSSRPPPRGPAAGSAPSRLLPPRPPQSRSAPGRGRAAAQPTTTTRRTSGARRISGPAAPVCVSLRPPPADARPAGSRCGRARPPCPAVCPGPARAASRGGPGPPSGRAGTHTPARNRTARCGRDGSDGWDGWDGWDGKGGTEIRGSPTGGDP